MRSTWALTLLVLCAIPEASSSSSAPEWWGGIARLTGQRSSPLEASGQCPTQPGHDTAWSLVADGQCRKTKDDKLSVYIVYSLVCNVNGSVDVKYSYPFTQDPGTPKCDYTNPPVHVAENFCWSGVPGTKGSELQCDSPSGNAQLLGWSGTAGPKYNQSNDKVVMTDGARVTTQTVFPPFVSFPPTGDEKLASLYIQNPYDLNGALGTALKGVADSIDSTVYSVTKLHFKCAVVVQQSRGLYTSGPPEEPDPPSAFDTGNHTKGDAGDTGTWMIGRNYSNGVILTQGISAMGMLATLAAGATPHMVTRATWLSLTTNNMREAFYRQGVLMIGVIGAILAPGYIPEGQCPRAPLAMHDSDAADPFWNPMKFEDWSTVSWPSVIRTSWFDMFQKGGLRLSDKYYNDARCAKVFGCTSTLLVDALGHSGSYGIPNCTGCFPYNETAQNLITGYEAVLSSITLFIYQDATNDVIAAGLNVFYAALMKFIPDKIVYVLGSGGNYLTSFDLWPVPVYQDLFLAENNTLTANSPASGHVSYVYDPSDPAPTYGGWYFEKSNPNGEASVDQSPLAARSDVLHFNGEVLAADTAVCGALNASLIVGSTANDTDFIVRLVDQYPSGERYLVAEGVIRMRWRAQTLEPVSMKPGTSYSAHIDMWSVCWIFAAGHRMGIDLTSSSEFMYLPNPNTGLPLEPDQIWPQGNETYKGPNITATNTINFGLSKIQLPIVAVSALPVIAPLIIPTPGAPPNEAELLMMGQDAMLYNQEYISKSRVHPYLK